MGAYRRLLKLAKPYYGKYLAALVLSALGAALNAGSMYMVKLTIDDVLTPKENLAGFDQVSRQLLTWTGYGADQPVAQLMSALLVIYPVLIVSVMLLKGAFNYFSDIIRNQAAHSIVLDARRQLFDKLTSLPLGFHSKQRLGDLSTRVLSDCQMMHSGVTDMVGRVAKAGLNILFLTVVIFFINWKFALQVLLIFPVAMGPLYYFGRKVRKFTYRGQERLADMNALLHETMAGIRVVFSFNMEKIERGRFFASAHEFFKAEMKKVKIQSVGTPVMDLIGGVGVAVMIFMAGSNVISGTLTLGGFMAMMGAIASIYPEVKNLNGVNVAVQQSIASSERVFSIIDAEETVAEKADAKLLQPIRNQIRFEGASFAYENSEAVLKNIDLEVTAGQRLAIVGPSGAGKTTLVDLVPRFHDPVSGRITLDGVDLRDASLESLRGQIGLVTQETFLFNDTIAANIGYGKPGAGKDEIEAAAKAANAHPFILEQRKGYDTEIGERGVRLSGGQRQRLAIARAILKNPPILILDEATSALDTESERLVQDALETLMAHRTTLVIAHRLSTVQGADHIVVLKDGEIVERGKHADLLAKEGLYAKLYKMQFREEVAA